MRIAMFSDCYQPVINGVVTSIACLRSALERAGHDVWLFVPSGPGYVEEEPRILRFHSWTFALQPEERFCFPLPLRNLRTFFKLNADLVHIHTPFNLGLTGLALARLQGVPTVFTHHTLWEEYIHYVPLLPRAFMRWFAVTLCRFFCQQARRVVAPSDEIRVRLRQQKISRPIDVIPTGIDAEVFRGGSAAGPLQELDLQSHETHFLYIGRIAREKSIDFVLKAFSGALQACPNVRLTLIGDGPERPVLEELAGSLGLGARVRFLGYRPREELRHYLAASRGLLFASQTETQGLVLLEAQSAGVPIVGVRASGITEAVADGRSGVLHPPGDLAAFTDSIVRLCLEDEFYSRLSAEARRWAEDFSSERMAARMGRTYRASLLPRAAEETAESSS